MVYADTNNFYFSDFTGDYYLTKDSEGVSHLKVVEEVTAEFPEFKQNKGICRQISFTNQDGKNITLPNLTRENLKLTRNGAPEPIYSIEKGAGYYDVCTGDDDYVLGTQVYRFEYEFSKVVTEFVDNGRDYQELYWDTNGNGALQRFDKVTARLHFEEPSWWSGESWCYVGKYGDNGAGRCTISRISDGVEFTASNLSAGENLTFDVELGAGNFVVPGPEKNYIYIWITVILGLICAGIIGWRFSKYYQVRSAISFYKGLFDKPEYQPSREYGLPEMAEIYLGEKKDAKVGMLLEMVVGRKIEFIKTGKKKWSIRVKNLDGLGKEYLDLLAILNGGTRPEVNEEIELKSRTATSELIALKKAMENTILGKLKREKLVSEGYKIGNTSGGTFGGIITGAILSTMGYLILLFVILVWLSDSIGIAFLENLGQEMVFQKGAFIVAIVLVAVTSLGTVFFNSRIRKYGKVTEAGLLASKYMDGLRLYIEMAEADRMKMLQSVEGADVSAEGIVKLYEKLLPYAAVFGLEESWMNEMKDYCKLQEIEEPDYLATSLLASDISRSLRSAANYATTATTMSSSGGSSSSGFSGGGGGGFSGGGGGGGGFSGR